MRKKDKFLDSIIKLPRLKVGLGKPIDFMRQGYKLEVDGTYWILKPKKKGKKLKL